MIEPVHTAVKGRTRYRVEGLYHSRPLKQFLEWRLAQEPDISSVSASTLTGNLLVSYNSDNTCQSISDLIRQALEELRGELQPGPEQPPVPSSAAVGAEKQTRNADIAGTAFADPERLQSAIRRLVFPHEEVMSRPWHTIKQDSVLDLLDTDSAGLAAENVKKRRRKYGANILPESEGRSRWDIFIDQINSLPVYLLGAAAGVSLLAGGVIDAVVVVGVVLANAAIGHKTESEAQKTIESLKELVHPRAEVLRGGQVATISAEEVVLGDILVLQPGGYVAADARIMRSSRLSVDESMLTGESLPVSKVFRKLTREKTPLPDRINMVFMGTRVTGGTGLAAVTATGPYTQMGRLQRLLADTTTRQTPIERQLEKTGDHLVFLFLIVCALVLLIGFARGYGFIPMLRMAISLAASAVPEGLPAAATINFALGINRMKRHSVLIRNLRAVETLGAVQTICLDKTGTITQNRMTVDSIFCEARELSFSGDRLWNNGAPFEAAGDATLEKLLRVCALCSETRENGRDAAGAGQWGGSPTENALMHLVGCSGLDIEAIRRRHHLLEVNHRSERRLYMSTLDRDGHGGHFLAVKGSPPEVLSMCQRQFKNGRIAPLTEADRRAIEIRNEAMAGDALRVLGFACAEWPDGNAKSSANRLVWLGLIGMADPVRDGVAELICKFHHAGIETVMITGDQSTTAYAVARRLALSHAGPLDILDSTELQRMDDNTMAALAKRVKVYSRVSPADKLKIVQALQAAGRTVAMTGDGINDGPALKAADIGIAMGGSGTDVAREVADIVLEEDNLETLITAVQDGRSTYRNIRKSVHFFLATNISEIIVMFTALAAGFGFPLNVMQLLWINIISDIFPGIALSMEEPEPDVLLSSPRAADAPLFESGDYRRMLRESVLISAGALAAYAYGFSRYGTGARAGTLAFQSLTIGQLLHALSCRSEKYRLLGRTRLPRNPYLTLAIGGSLLMQVATVFLRPLRGFLGLTPLGPVDVAVAGGGALAGLIANEASKPSLP